jgi:hypothetical protein
MGGSSIFFTSMATGMILSVSWGTKELDGEEGPDGRGEGSDVTSGTSGKTNGKGKEGSRSRTNDRKTDETGSAGNRKGRDAKIEVEQPEFEING